MITMVEIKNTFYLHHPLLPIFFSFHFLYLATISKELEMPKTFGTFGISIIESIMISAMVIYLYTYMGGYLAGEYY